MKHRALAVFLLIIISWSGTYAQQDTAAYRAATALLKPQGKIDALNIFVKQYPESRLTTRAYDALFDAYAGLGDEQGALNAADNSLKSLAPESRMSPYNRFAYNLAKNGIGLDSALAYIERAIEMAGTSRNLSAYQDTKAYVLFRLGRPAEAEALQLIAIKGHEDDPEYLGNLALYEHANGKVQNALKTITKALYFGGDPESKQHFMEWISQAEKEDGKRDALKRSVVTTTFREMLDTLKGNELISARSNAAGVMADLAVELKTARQWADAGVKALDKKSPLGDVIRFKQSLALVLSAQNKHKEALAQLRSIEPLVDPYDSRYWLALGRTHEQLGNHPAAILAFMNGLIARNDKTLRAALEHVYARQHSSLDGIDKQLDSLRASSADIEPGHYGKAATANGKVVLAELFTGAECGPCASSDLAFDALIEYYPRTAVAIVEYHVHIPGPDPMTTDESWDRYTWYAGQGTPTVVIDGRESIIGGGPKTVTKNRFGVYRYAIQKFESEKPRVQLSMSVSRSGDDIAATIRVARTKATTKTGTTVVHAALVERSVEYTGANGITKHAFVVRRMLDDAQGTTISLQQPETTLSKKANVAEVEQRIKAYLDNPSAQRSWSYRRSFAGWRARPENIDRSNLAIVAWVQDVESKEVMQAVYQDVPALIGSK